MKKIALMLSLAASVLVLSSCANKGTTDQNTAPAQPVAHHGHHDYKGETR